MLSKKKLKVSECCRDSEGQVLCRETLKPVPLEEVPAQMRSRLLPVPPPRFAEKGTVLTAVVAPPVHGEGSNLRKM